MRREIQGLRAVAVLLVVLFHLWPGRVPGGYIGVDVFFVISGFLITSLLLREVDRSGSVSLGQFWARRLRRLLPASYLVLAVSAVGTLLFVPRLVWEQFFGEILGAGLYVENWVLAVNSVDYLAAENAPSPAQHYWTLSAEEQFYLVWPLLVLLGIWLARRATRRSGVPAVPRRAVFAVLAVGVVASLAYSLWVSATNPAWAYFVTPARAWEFGAGALLAFAPPVAATGPRPRPRPAGLGCPRRAPGLRAGPRRGHRDARAPRRSGWWSPPRPSSGSRHPGSPGRATGCSRSGRRSSSVTCRTPSTCGTGR